MKWKLCKYAVCVPEPERDALLLFNTLNSALVRITDSAEKSWLQALFRAGCPQGGEDGAFLAQLVKMRFLLPVHLQEAVIARYVFQEAYRQNRTLSFLVYVTNACNFRCSYCPEPHTSEIMSAETAQALCTQIETSLSGSRFERLSLSWFGGEPLLNQPVIEAVMARLRPFCQEQGVLLSGGMTTNGYLLTAETAERLLSIGVNQFQITLDGVAETHDRTRPLADGSASWQRIWTNLLELSKRPEAFQVNLRVNANQRNLESAKVLLNLIASLKDPRFSIMVNPISNMGGDPGCDEYCSVEDGQRVQLALYEWLLSHPLPGIANAVSRIYPMGMLCNAARPDYYVITTDGAISKCELNVDSEFSVLRSAGAYGGLDTATLAHYVTPATGDCEDCVLYPLCFGLICPHKRTMGLPCTYRESFLFDEHVRLLAKTLDSIATTGNEVNA